MKLMILVIIVFGVLVDSYWFDLRLRVPPSVSPKAGLTVATSQHPMLFTTIGQSILFETALPVGTDVYTPIYLWLPSWWF
jgi:hypothetical protein